MNILSFILSVFPKTKARGCPQVSKVWGQVLESWCWWLFGLEWGLIVRLCKLSQSRTSSKWGGGDTGSFGWFAPTTNGFFGQRHRIRRLVLAQVTLLVSLRKSFCSPKATISDLTNYFPKIICSVFYIAKFYTLQFNIQLLLESFAGILIGSPPISSLPRKQLPILSFIFRLILDTTRGLSLLLTSIAALLYTLVYCIDPVSVRFTVT